MDQYYPQNGNPRKTKRLVIAGVALLVLVLGILAYIFKDELTGLFTGAKPTPVFCKNRNPIGIPGMMMTFAAVGGNGTSYNWTAQSGTPASGTGQGFATKYDAIGDYVIQVESGGATGNCNVKIINPAPDLDWGRLTLNSNGGDLGASPYYQNSSLALPCLAPLRTVRGQSFTLDTESRFTLSNKGFADATNIEVTFSQQGIDGVFDGVQVTAGTFTKINDTQAKWNIPKIIPAAWANITFKKNGVVANGTLMITGDVTASTPIDFDRNGDSRVTMICDDNDYLTQPLSNAFLGRGTVAGQTVIAQAETGKETSSTEESAVPTPIVTKPEQDSAEAGQPPIIDPNPPTEPPVIIDDPIEPIDPPPDQEVCVDDPGPGLDPDIRILKDEVLIKNIGPQCIRFTFKGYDVPSGNVYPFSDQVLKQEKVFTVSAGETVIVELDQVDFPCNFQTDLFYGDRSAGASGQGSGAGGPIAYDFMEHKCVDPPTGALTCSPPQQTAQVGQPVNFSSTNGSVPIWTAPGGNPVGHRGQNFTTTYSAEGQYTVVVESNGYTATCSVTVGTTPPPPPPPTGEKLSCVPAQHPDITPGSSATFTADGGSGSYSWSTEGDNPTKPPTGQSVTFTYAQAGSYIVTVTDTSQPAQTAMCKVNVTATPQPTLTCIQTDQVAVVGSPVRFRAVYTGQALTYRWSAPQGNPSTGLADTFQTTYSARGNYLVTVEVGGLTSTCNVTVADAPNTAEVVCSPESQVTEVNKEVSFTATGGNGTYSWQVTNDNTANPLTGTGATFRTVFTTPTRQAAAKLVTVTSGGKIDTCGVTVNDATGTDPNADLAIIKTVNNSTPRVGDQVIYTLVITNNGPNDATGVVVNDVVPAGVSYIIPQPTGSQPNPSNGNVNFDSPTRTLRWNVGALGANRNATYFFTVTVNQGGTITNTAAIEPNALPDPVPTNNTSSVIITPQTGGGDTTYDVAIEKTVSNSSPQVGSSVQFTITATNTRTATVTGVVVKDALPSTLTYNSHTAASGTYNQSTGDWTIGTLTGGASVTLRITATPNTSGSITNTAALDDVDQNDNNSSNNQDSVTITASSGGGGGGSSSTDLDVSKTVSNTTPSVGQQITYTVTVFNNGPRDASSAEIEDILPAGLTYVSSSTANGSYNQNTGRWIIDDLDEGQTATLQIVAIVNQVGTITNTAELIDSSPNDNESDNDEDSVTITVGGGVGSGSPDVSVVKTVNNDRPVVGGQITYVINVANRGGIALTGLTIEDKLPTQVSFVKVQTSSGSYDKNTGIWTIGTLASGTGAVMHITVSVLKVGTFTNLARLNTVDQNDSDTTNNQSQVTVTSKVVPGLPAAGFNTAAPVLIGFLFILLAFVVHFLGGTKRKAVAAQSTDI